MALADRVQPLMRYYDQWMRLITGGYDAVVRAAALKSVRPEERLLDVGCGAGSLAIAAARRGARVVGIDRSRPMLTIAREKAPNAGVTRCPPAGRDTRSRGESGAHALRTAGS
jgi:ubiquinone/menaquinone biosynthesis C-methylase UbiE